MASQRVDKDTPLGMLVKEEDLTCVADKKVGADEARKLRQLRAAACAHQIAFDPLAGQKGLMLQSAVPRMFAFGQTLRTEMQGFSQRAALHYGADDPEALEQLCLHITCPALANERMQCHPAGHVALSLNTLWRDGTCTQ